GHADVAGRQTETDEGGVHSRALPGDADIGGERQGEAAAAGGALDQADDRLAATAHAHHDLADAALTEQAGIGSAGGIAVAAGTRLLEVQTGAEGAPGTAQHDDAYRAVEIELAEIVEQLVDELGVERVQRLGPVHRHPVHGAFFLDQQSL